MTDFELTNLNQDLLIKRIDKLLSTRTTIEMLSGKYRAIIMPMREALQAVNDVPLSERDRWASKVSALAVKLSGNYMAEVPQSLVTVQRWEIQFNSGSIDQALVGQTFCASLAAAIKSGLPPLDFFKFLDSYPFITNSVASSEICNVLNRLLFLQLNHTNPIFASQCKEIFKIAGYDGPTLFHCLNQIGQSISEECFADIQDWNDYDGGLRPFESVRPSDFGWGDKQAQLPNVTHESTSDPIKPALTHTHPTVIVGENLEGGKPQISNKVVIALTDVKCNLLPHDLAELIASVEKAGLIGVQAKVVQSIAQHGGRIPIPDADIICKGDALSALKKVKLKLKKYGWNFRQHDKCLLAERLPKVQN